MERLFTTYLFPDLSHRTEHHVIQPNIPVMHNLTRQEIYNVLILLCEDPANCGRMLELLKDIIPQGTAHVRRCLVRFTHFRQITLMSRIGSSTVTRPSAPPRDMLDSRTCPTPVT